MINSIEIIIKYGIREILNAQILYNDNICILNNMKHEINKEFKDNIINTIYLWKNEYGSDNNSDSEEFLIKVTSKEGIDTYHGKGIFPANYESLKRLLGEVNEK